MGRKVDRNGNLSGKYLIIQTGQDSSKIIPNRTREENLAKAVYLKNTKTEIRKSQSHANLVNIDIL